MSYEYSEDNLVEETAHDLFYNKLGWDIAIAYNNETFGVHSTYGRKNKKQVVLEKTFLEKLKEFNPGLPDQAYNNALEQILFDSTTKSIIDLNREKYNLIRDGIPVSYTDSKGKKITDRKLKIIDFQDPLKNNFHAIRQLWIEGRSGRLRRPDIIGFVNGIPLLFIELKAVHQQLESAWSGNLSDYKDVIPKLFHYNAFIILSNGIQGKIGSVTGHFRHFHEWKRINEEDEGIVGLDRIILGICDKKRFLDLFENFIVFDESTGKQLKIIAKNHQFIGVNRTLDAFKEKNDLYNIGRIEKESKQKLGVFWHTQGSGKSYSMLFLCQKLHRKFSESFTFLIVTDRNELENQIYGTFTGSGAISKSLGAGITSIRAESGEHLKELLKQNHRYIFSLIHKFNFEGVISERSNIIVVSDEAHRTQGGILALNLRNALPNASFIGFTGTPLFKHDEITKRIFGEYVSKYDFRRSVIDGATVPLYYENRGELLGISNPDIAEQMQELIDSEDDLNINERSKIENLFQREYPVLTANKRLDAVAKDVVNHFFKRGYKGKGMFISIDKVTAVKMYNLIMKYKAKYEVDFEKGIKKGIYEDQEELEKTRELKWIRETEICVVVSGEQNEVGKFESLGLDIDFHREKMNFRDLETEFKDPDNPFRFVIVCAMWITGFDVPSLSTLYIDKPLKAHTLMQTIARANRINEGKENGLIVDYIETYKDLLKALSVYGEGDNGGGGTGGPPVKPKEVQLEELKLAIDSLKQYLNGLGFELNLLTGEKNKLVKTRLVADAINCINENDKSRKRFMFLARDVFQKFHAIMPDNRLGAIKPDRDAIDAIYKTIENDVQSADVSELMGKIQSIVDSAIVSIVREENEEKSNPVDLSSLNFETLKKMFSSSEHKNSIIFALKEKIKNKLDEMINQNPLRVDYFKKYQEIIAKYNDGKSAMAIEEAFRLLLEQIDDMTFEEVRIKREGLSEEQGAIFDILRKPKLNNQDKIRVRRIAIELLDVLKKEELKVSRWSEQTTIAAQVEVKINQTLFQQLPDPEYTKDDIDLRSVLILEHLKNQYYGGGLSVYGRY